jgi:hypothetical protein
MFSLCLSLLFFAFSEDMTTTQFFKFVAFGLVISIGGAAFYPEVRGIKQGDMVSVVIDSALPSLIGRYGRAVSHGRKNQHIKVKFDNGEEALGIVESYQGLFSPPKVRILYEEKLVE